MEKEFIPYEQALALNELGFDEECFAWYVSKNYGLEFGKVIQSSLIKDAIIAPTYSQAFRWFREKYSLTSEVSIEQYRRKTDKKWMFSITYLNEDAMYEHSKTTFDTYEEAELECLKKLIEIVKETL